MICFQWFFKNLLIQSAYNPLLVYISSIWIIFNLIAISVAKISSYRFYNGLASTCIPFSSPSWGRYWNTALFPQHHRYLNIIYITLLPAPPIRLFFRLSWFINNFYNCSLGVLPIVIFRSWWGMSSLSLISTHLPSRFQLYSYAFWQPRAPIYTKGS